MPQPTEAGRLMIFPDDTLTHVSPGAWDNRFFIHLKYAIMTVKPGYTVRVVVLSGQTYDQLSDSTVKYFKDWMRGFSRILSPDLIVKLHSGSTARGVYSSINTEGPRVYIDIFAVDAIDRNGSKREMWRKVLNRSLLGAATPSFNWILWILGIARYPTSILLHCDPVMRRNHELPANAEVYLKRDASQMPKGKKIQLINVD